LFYGLDMHTLSKMFLCAFLCLNFLPYTFSADNGVFLAGDVLYEAPPTPRPVVGTVVPDPYITTVQQPRRITRPCWLEVREWRRLDLLREMTLDLKESLMLWSSRDPNDKDVIYLCAAVIEAYKIIDQSRWALRKVLEQRDFLPSNRDFWDTLSAYTLTDVRCVNRAFVETAMAIADRVSIRKKLSPFARNLLNASKMYFDSAKCAVAHADALYARIKADPEARAARHAAKVRAGEAREYFF
jgi:hypothetical protein